MGRERKYNDEYLDKLFKEVVLPVITKAHPKAGRIRKIHTAMGNTLSSPALRRVLRHMRDKGLIVIIDKIGYKLP